MAGYGTSVEAPTELDVLVRVLLRAAQRRAEKVGLRMRFRRTTENSRSKWYMSVDGNGYVIAAWTQQLERELPIVAEGYVGLGQGGQAHNAAVSLVARWIGQCVGDEESAVISASGKDTGRWLWPIIEVPEPPHRLAPRLTISDSLVGRWIVGDMPEEIAIEELHTLVEGLLRTVLSVGRGPNWPSLLEAARERYLTSDECQTLAAFNQLRRNQLKHAAEALSDEERRDAKTEMANVLQIAERLLARL